MWWLNAPKGIHIEQIIQENVYKEEKKTKLRLKFSPKLDLIGLQTTGTMLVLILG